MRKEPLVLACILGPALLLAAERRVPPWHLSATEQVLREQEAASGNADSAWRLYQYYAIKRRDRDAAAPWLRRAAELRHGQAQRTLGLAIKRKDPSHSYLGFGDTEAEAFRTLLDRASHTVGDACYELADAYATGYFGPPDLVVARAYYQRGALLNSRMCWKKLSEYLANGKGGPVNRPEAYYWIALETRSTDPRSVGGKEDWASREEIAQHLLLGELQHQWERIDSFIARITAKDVEVDYAPFLSGMIDPKLEEEGRRHSEESEKEHRAKWKQMKG